MESPVREWKRSFLKFSPHRKARRSPIQEAFETKPTQRLVKIKVQNLKKRGQDFAFQILHILQLISNIKARKNDNVLTWLSRRHDFKNVKEKVR
jgi:hypothetical protein